MDEFRFLFDCDIVHGDLGADFETGVSLSGDPEEVVDVVFDWNGDGLEDSFEVAEDHVAIHLARPLQPGDADGNGSVDFSDFLILSANFGAVDAVWADGDFNSNGEVDFSDFLILSQNFA